MFALGLFTSVTFQNFLHLQGQNLSSLSVYNEIIKPLSGLVLLSQILIIVFCSSLISPYFSNVGQKGLFIHSNLTNPSLVWLNLIVVFTFSLLPVGIFIFILLALISYSQVDVFLILNLVSALILVSGIFCFISIAVSFVFNRALITLTASFIIIVLLFIIEQFLRNFSPGFSFVLSFLLAMREGLFDVGSLISVFLWLAFSFLICLFSIGHFRKNNNLSYKHLIAVFFGIAIFQLAYSQLFVSSVKDISQHGINSLNEKIAEQLNAINEPIKLVAIVENQASKDEIEKAVSIIRRYQPNIEVDFTNRQAYSDSNEFVEQFVAVRLGNLQQAVAYPFDKPAQLVISDLILQLTNRSKQWITFIEGHGEASIFGKTNRDITQFYHSIKELGWPISAQNFSRNPIITNNTKLAVIAAGKTEWLPAEVNALTQYLKGGGNLLLLREHDDKIPKSIEHYLGIEKMPGVLIDWNGYQSGTPHPAVLIINNFADHPINTGVNSLIAMPWAVGLERLTNKVDNFEYESVMSSQPKA